MPREIEERLKRSAERKGYKPGSEKYNAYVYGTLDKIEKERKRERRDDRS